MTAGVPERARPAYRAVFDAHPLAGLLTPADHGPSELHVWTLRADPRIRFAILDIPAPHATARLTVAVEDPDRPDSWTRLTSGAHIDRLHRDVGSIRGVPVWSYLCADPASRSDWPADPAVLTDAFDAAYDALTDPSTLRTLAALIPGPAW